MGGLAVRNNLLCVTWTAGRGHVFLYDLDARERMSSWTTPVGPSGFSGAGGVAIDARFRLFVTDPTNGCLRRYNAFGQHLGDVGLPAPASGDRGRDRLGVLDHPNAVACQQGRVWVAMGERPRRQGVQCFDVHGKALRALPARGEAGEHWAAPRGLWCDDEGLLVADTLRGRVQVFRADGSFLHERALPGGSAARPGAVARTSKGQLWVIDHSGERARLVGLGVDGAALPLGSMTDACRDPVALALDRSGGLLVLDQAGERVMRLDAGVGELRVLVDLSEHDAELPGGSE